MEEALRTAIALAARGHRVLPIFGIVGEKGTALQCACPLGAECKSPGKHPYTQLVPRGLLDATTDVDVVRKWGNVPNLNYAVTTDLFVVLDTDGEVGAETLRALERKHGALPHTWTVSTGSRQGRHRYFLPPSEIEVRNSAGRLGKNVDVRAQGGYVIVPGSRHITGMTYQWWDRHHPRSHRPAECPAWLVELANNGNGKGTGNGVVTPADYAALFRQTTPEGERRSTLCRIAGHFIANLIAPAILLDVMQCWNAIRCDPPLPQDEVEGVVRSLYAKHTMKAST